MGNGCSEKGTWGVLSAWALAFGCTVGWGSFIMPGTTFLPAAGPLGTVLGISLGGIVMAVVAWNYRCMIERHPGSGGAYSCVREVFGFDHAFVCGWFLCLTYVAIVWANATALSLVSRAIFGDLFAFGFHYSVAGYEIYLGDLLLSGLAIAAGAAMCLRPRLAARMETAFALAFVSCAAVLFAVAVVRHGGGGAPSTPIGFAPGSRPVLQVLRIVALAPWLFVGFEGIANVSPEFRFAGRRSFGVMAAALVASVAVYLFLALLPALAPSEAAVAPLSAKTLPVPTFRSAAAMLGTRGVLIIGIAVVSAIFTNLIGDTVVASRLVAAMASDGIFPKQLGGRGRDSPPNCAILAIAAVSMLVPFLGRTAIGLIVDVSTFGAAMSYAYVSAAAFKVALAEGRRLSAVVGAAGFVLSLGVVALFVVPNILSDSSIMATESYLIMSVWCISGLVVSLSIFRGDRRNRFGRSPVVWLSLMAMILFLSVMWVRQSLGDAVERTHGDVTSRGVPLREALSALNRSVLRDSYVQTGATVVSFALLLALYAIFRRREREQEQERARAKDFFFSTVSHDIRTPLNAIIGFSEMLRDGLKTGEERAQALESIIVSGKTLMGLINDVLDLSKLESGRMEIVAEPTDFQRLAQELVDAFRLAADGRGIELRCSVGALPQLMVDPQRIRQIVFNLVGNAVKFTTKGHVELRASYTADDAGDKGTFVLEVEDTGCGISEEDVGRIMSAYVQVGSRLGRTGGTGLGLAICRQLATAMGGTLTVKSELGRGSTFTLTLPGVVRTRNAAALPAAPRPEEPEAKPAPSSRDKRVLVVDDMEVNLMVLVAYLGQIGGVEVLTASDGVKALEVLKAHAPDHFDLVLTDMWMPNMDGVELVRAIRGDANLAHLRVVVVTADVELSKRVAETGFDDILLKPVTGEKLREVLAK